MLISQLDLVQGPCFFENKNLNHLVWPWYTIIYFMHQCLIEDYTHKSRNGNQLFIQKKNFKS